MFGCYATSTARSVHPQGSVAGVSTLCLRDDFTFARVDETGVLSRSGGVIRGTASQGSWAYEGGTLTLSFEDEDGEEAEMQLRVEGVNEDGLVVGGVAWRRTPEDGDDLE